MLVNRWSRDYLRGLFESMGKTYGDLQQLVQTWISADVEDPCLPSGQGQRCDPAQHGYDGDDPKISIQSRSSNWKSGAKM